LSVAATSAALGARCAFTRKLFTADGRANPSEPQLV
jgi:hypothetical protein